jgi:hypothetical protein
MYVKAFKQAGPGMYVSTNPQFYPVNKPPTAGDTDVFVKVSEASLQDITHLSLWYRTSAMQGEKNRPRSLFQWWMRRDRGRGSGG